MTAITGLLDQARALRATAHGLMRDVASGSEARAEAATTSQAELDYIIRNGSSVAELKAFYAKFDGQYEAAKGRQAQLEEVSKHFGDLFNQLAAAVDVKSTDPEQTFLQGEVNLCRGVMAEIGVAVREANMETAVAAALAGKQIPGSIIGARAATGSRIIRPEGFGTIIHP